VTLRASGIRADQRVSMDSNGAEGRARGIKMRAHYITNIIPVN
jgi:hypothetical protein